jgi:hypothetical protein
MSKFGLPHDCSDRTFAITLFPNGATDKHPVTSRGNLETLFGLFERTWTPRPVPPGIDPKKGQPAYAGAEYLPQTTRAQQNVYSTQVLAIDFDCAKEVETGEFHLGRDGKPSNRPKLLKVCISDPVLPEDVVAVLAMARVAAMLYTTWSDRPDWPRFRVIVPYAQPVPANLYRAATAYAVDALGLEPLLRGADRPALLDIARMYFLPGAPDPGAIRRWRLAGHLLNIPLDQVTAYTLPEPPLMPWQEEILRQKAASKPTWIHSLQTKKRVDFRDLDLVALLQAIGVKVGRPQSYRSGTKWRTHCPWASEHTHGLDDDCAVVIHAPGHWPIWRCAHSHHAHLGLRDLLEAFGGAL